MNSRLLLIIYFIHSSVYMSILSTLPIFPTLPSPFGNNVYFLHLWLCLCFPNTFLCTFLLDSPSVQFTSVTQSCPTPWDPMNCIMPGLPVHYQLPEFNQTQVHQVSDASQPSHPLSSPFPPTPNPSQHQGLFQWVNSLHQVAKELEFQL